MKLKTKNVRRKTNAIDATKVKHERRRIGKRKLSANFRAQTRNKMDLQARKRAQENDICDSELTHYRRRKKTASWEAQTAPKNS